MKDNQSYPEKAVGEGVFLEVTESGVLDLEVGEVGGCGDGLLAEGVDDGGLVACGVDELVIHDLDTSIIVLVDKQSDLIGDGGCIHEGRDVLADLGETELDLLAIGSTELGLAFLAEDDQVVGGFVVEEHFADGT